MKLITKDGVFTLIEALWVLLFAAVFFGLITGWGIIVVKLLGIE